MKQKVILIAGANGRFGRAMIPILEQDANNRTFAVGREFVPNINQLSSITYLTYFDKILEGIC